MKPKTSHPEKVIHASIGFKKKLDEILASKSTLSGLVDTSGANPKKSSSGPNKPKSNKREQPTAKNRAKMLMKPKKGTLPDNSGKQKMPEINQKKERITHPNQIKQMAKKALVIKSEKTPVEINPAGAKYHYNSKKGWHPNPNLGKSTVKPKKTGSDTGISGKKVGAKPTPASTSKYKNPLAPHKMENGTTLFSAFDKPSEYKAIRAGKQHVKPAIIPEVSPNWAGKKPSTPKPPKRSGTKVEGAPKASGPKTKVDLPGNPTKVSKPPKSSPSAHEGDTSVSATPKNGLTSISKPPKIAGSIKKPGNSFGGGGGSGLSKPKETHYEVPAHPNAKLSAYSPLKHFSNMFSSPVTARASAAARGAYTGKQIFRPQSLVMRKSLQEVGIKEKSFKAHLAGVLAGAMSMAAMNNSHPASVKQPEVLAAHQKTPHFEESHDKGRSLKAIAAVESSGGINTDHPTIRVGLSKGTSALGKYGLTPLLVREIAGKGLKEQHGHLATASDSDLKQHFKDHPDVEDTFAAAHYDHISHALGTKDLKKIGLAWHGGIEGAKKAISSGKDFSKDPYVQKVSAAYNKPH